MRSKRKPHLMAGPELWRGRGIVVAAAAPSTASRGNGARGTTLPPAHSSRAHTRARPLRPSRRPDRPSGRPRAAFAGRSARPSADSGSLDAPGRDRGGGRFPPAGGDGTLSRAGPWQAQRPDFSTA
jgi:hypothetical protein